MARFVFCERHRYDRECAASKVARARLERTMVHRQDIHPVLRFALLLRFVTLLAAVGAAFGAILMFWQGGLKLVGAVNETYSITIGVMEATDAFLFGLVLIVFAYGVTFGFAFDLPRAAREKLPVWMRVDGIGELKNALVQTVLVYLVVDFATDIAEAEEGASWTMIVKPASIVLIAGALRLLGHTSSESHTRAEGGVARASSPNQR